MPRQIPSSGTARRDPLGDQLVEAELADPLHRLRECADAGQHEAVGRRRDLGRVGGDHASAPTRSSAFSTERRLPIP